MFWQANDVENKHFFVGFSYAEKDDTQSLEVSVSTDVFMKLMGPVFQLVCNVTCDKLFTSLGLVWWLAEKTCSRVRKMSQNRKFQKIQKEKGAA